jgi:hypothetical protein
VELRASLLPIAALLCGSPSVARASCAIDLEGDPDVIARVHDPLVAFGDDSVTCVDVEVLCSRDADEIVLDLRDALGRSVQRRFRTPEGAAAFLVSWSRRPLPQAGTPLEQAAPPPPDPSARTSKPATSPRPAPPRPASPRVATPPVAAPSEAPAPLAPPGLPLPMTAGVGLIDRTTLRATSGSLLNLALHPELRLAYVTAPLGAQSVDGVAGLAEAAALIRSGVWRYGAELRGASATATQTNFGAAQDKLHWYELDVEGTFGPRLQGHRFQLGAELFGGFGIVSPSSRQGFIHVRGYGPRGGVRIAIASLLAGGFWFEARAGWDGLRQIGQNLSPGEIPLALADSYFGQVHMEIGLLWAP